MQLFGIFTYICTMNTKSKTKDFENSIAPWLGKTVKIVEYHLQETFDQHHIDLTKEQMIVLKKLHNKDGLNQNELAFLTLRNKSSLTRLLRKMEKKKYISRKQSKVDKRINNVYLTDLGREIFKKTRPVIQKIIDVMEQHITEKEKQQIIHTLKKIQFNFNSKEPSL